MKNARKPSLGLIVISSLVEVKLDLSEKIGESVAAEKVWFLRLQGYLVSTFLRHREERGKGDDFMDPAFYDIRRWNRQS